MTNSVQPQIRDVMGLVKTASFQQVYYRVWNRVWDRVRRGVVNRAYWWVLLRETETDSGFLS